MKGFFLIILGFLPLLCFSQVYGPILFQWDFSNGIESDWESFTEDGISEWQYRGPDTTPSNEFGSVGSCGFNSVPINSPSASNGFVIFDANFWDAIEGPCGGDNIGTGPSPAPHFATLTTPSFSLEDESTVVLSFVQQYRHFNTETSVQVSVDNGDTWTSVHVNPTNQNSQSSSGEWINIDISAVAGGQANVKVRFTFDGFYYWWLLDDITIYRPAVNNLELVTGYYSGYDGQSEPAGYGKMEYTGYPSIMPPTLQFLGNIRNVGSATQTGVRLNGILQDADGNELYNQLSGSVSLAAQNSSDFTINATYPISNELQSYSVQISAVQNESDEQPEINTFHKAFKITPYTYQFDLDTVEQSYIPPSNFAGSPYQIGSAYEAKDDSLQLFSLGVAITAPTAPGVEIYGLIYNDNFTEVIMETEPYIVNEWDINEIGEGKIIHMNFQEPVFTENNTLYIVMVGTLDAENNMVHVGRSGPAFATSSLVRYNNSATFFMPRATMVRAHLFEKDAKPGCLDSQAMNFDPEADTDDGSCRYPGCIDPEASNFDPDANFATDTCEYLGCTDPEAANYDPDANVDDGSCEYLGCTDPEALNFDETANVNDGSCVYSEAFLGASDSTGCAPHTITFFNQTDTVSESQCEFLLDDVLIIENCVEEFDLTFDVPGTYFVTFNHSVLGTSSSFTFGPIMIYEAPETPAIVFDEAAPLLECTNCGNNNIQWFLDGEPIEDATSSTFTPVENGLYNLLVTTDEGCSAQSNEIDVIVVHISESHLTDLLVYPNPANTSLRIRSVERIQQLNIYDLKGKLVATHDQLENDFVLDVSSLSVGVYFIQAASERRTETLRIVIQR